MANLEVLNANVNKLNAEINIANAQYTKLQAGVELYRALGGSLRNCFEIFVKKAFNAMLRRFL